MMLYDDTFSIILHYIVCITSGPRGSVLDATLFLLFINDIDEFFCGTGVHV